MIMFSVLGLAALAGAVPTVLERTDISGLARLAEMLAPPVSHKRADADSSVADSLVGAGVIPSACTPDCASAYALIEPCAEAAKTVDESLTAKCVDYVCTVTFIETLPICTACIKENAEGQFSTAIFSLVNSTLPTACAAIPNWNTTRTVNDTDAGLIAATTTTDANSTANATTSALSIPSATAAGGSGAERHAVSGGLVAAALVGAALLL